MIGTRIRELRSERNLTVAQLATASGVPSALLSQVERNRDDPSLETLRKIAKALELPLFSLFQESDPALVAVIRAEARVRVKSPSDGITYTRVSPGRGRLEVLEGHLLPGGSSASEPWSHPSEECVMVLRGRLVVEVSGISHELEAGDSCYFDSSLPHRYLNTGTEPTDFIIAATPPSY
ncbi:helix-turn-helix domain-containing protein [Nonomuraea aurantiaca]|uniref:helix-turn-helix domain-containing protein n=1 Tax=Nonomuraea aurantiaca TaxID=2878562 RepID=UPI001CD9C088|nr:XRE family transcriptional regulator [Nonomuraea aurantiaca]MCA2225558.1 XRE family transcriptional regulator [Nonomuraea aurantiaca]